MKRLRPHIVCRDNAIKQLFSLIGICTEPLPNSIFIFGHMATGKSLVVECLVELLPYNYVLVNCIEHFSSRQLLEYILSNLLELELSSESNFKMSQKCENMAEFLVHLRNYFRSNGRPIVVVLDKCERLRSMDANLLPALLRLQELSGVKICTIFISSIVWEKFQTRRGTLEPLKIHFPQYTHEELIDILSLYKPGNCELTFYRGYINTLLLVFCRACRDLNELRYVANLHFSKYVDPIEAGRCDVNDARTLWRNISGIFRSSLEVIYLRVSAADFQQEEELSRSIESTTKLALSFELPFHAKYMLIAAFLASYNPAKEDKRIFMKRTGKSRKKSILRKQVVKRKEHSSPRSFPLDRMLAIFCAILNEKVDVNANLLAQIPTMCHLGLLATVGDNNLDEPKYKCCVGYDFVAVISKTLRLDVSHYMYDHSR